MAGRIPVSSTEAEQPESLQQVLIGPKTARELDSDALLRALLQELSPSQAAKVAAHVTGGKRSELYEAALRLGK